MRQTFCSSMSLKVLEPAASAVTGNKPLAAAEGQGNVAAVRHSARNFRTASLILHFATTDLTARMDSSTPGQIRDVTFRSDGGSGAGSHFSIRRARGSKNTPGRLRRCECYRGIIGIQSQENRSIYRQFDV
jgi:hypothetical protein